MQRRVPILALVDADPYGLDILSVYKYGSVAMRHENGRLAAGSIEWLGVWSSELTGRVFSGAPNQSEAHPVQGWEFRKTR
jgi:DNA topoisomerase VI subunit A